MKYFNNCKTLEELRKEYKRLVKQNHPDNGGSVDEIKIINVEYETALNNLKEADENGNTIVVNDKNEILSNNIFANNDFMQALEQVNAGKLQALYISDKMKENIDLLRESGYFDS